MNRHDWIQLARDVVIDMIEHEYAVTPREIEARAAIDSWRISAGLRIDPDILTEARHELEAEDVIAPTKAFTRGGRPVETWSLSNRRGISTQIERAAARKRLLTARHASWSQSTQRNPKGLIGQAGENVLYGLFTELDPYSHIQRDAETALSTPIPGGSVDLAGYLTVESQTGPLAITFLAEVKNQRQWFYRSNPQLHRFLAKAAFLQNQNPGALLVPVFAASWRHNSAWLLGRLLGFYAVGYRLQYVLDRAEVNRQLFSEVVNDLGYSDLRLGVQPNISLRGAFETALPRDAVRVARRWAQTAPLCQALFEAIRDARNAAARETLVNQLIRLVERRLGTDLT